MLSVRHFGALTETRHANLFMNVFSHMRVRAHGVCVCVSACIYTNFYTHCWPMTVIVGMSQFPFHIMHGGADGYIWYCVLPHECNFFACYGMGFVQVEKVVDVSCYMKQ